MKARTSTFLMANLGSDVSQLFSHLEDGEMRLAAAAAKRAQGIIEELLAVPELAGRTWEIEILRDVIDDALSKNRRFLLTRDELDYYFLPFSLRALAER